MAGYLLGLDLQASPENMACSPKVVLMLQWRIQGGGGGGRSRRPLLFSGKYLKKSPKLAKSYQKKTRGQASKTPGRPIFLQILDPSLYWSIIQHDMVQHMTLDQCLDYGAVMLDHHLRCPTF